MGVQFLTMFHMSSDSGLFRDSPGLGLVPLYEAKLFHQFDHQYATYEGATQEQLNMATLPRLPLHAKADPYAGVMTRYWVDAREVEAYFQSRWARRWLLAFRDIARATDERTAIFTILPRVGLGNKAPLLLTEQATPLSACLLGNLNSAVLDYCARQKVAGASLNVFIVKQFAVLPPTAFTEVDVDFIVQRELGCPTLDN